MDAGYRSPLVDLFRRGDAPREARMLAAQGAMAPRAHEQLSILILLANDADAEVAAQAKATIERLPVESLRAVLGRADTPAEVRGFFAARQVEPADGSTADVTEPLVDALDTLPEVPDAEDDGTGTPRQLSSLPIADRLKLAMKGTREHRAQLIRDPNRIVAVAVLSSPKLNESEIEAFARMPAVSEEVLRLISTNRTWTKNYGVIIGLVRNPKTPAAISMQLLHRLNERDTKMLSTDRNVPEALRLAARKIVAKNLR